MLNVLIVDDEPLAHEVLLHHCRSHSDIRIVGQCLNAAEALAAINAKPVDLMFLDIRMPRFGGLDLLRGLASPPLTVIVSAHKEYALDGYDLDVVDYLLKPVSAKRFDASLDKVRRRLAADTPSIDDDLVLKVDRALRRFRLGAILRFEAEGNFVKIWSEDDSCLATITLRKLQDMLPTERFVRIHKSHIISRAHIVETRSGSISLSDGSSIPIGKSYRGQKGLLT